MSTLRRATRARGSSRARRTSTSPSDDVPRLLQFAKQHRIELTIVGPEAPLVIGIVDAFAAAGLRCFGPSQACARLEGSKAFSKDFLKRYGIPTAAYATYTRATFDASWVRAQQAPLVVKADGLAAGKGVVICATSEEAVATAQGMFAGQFGKAGETVVVEEFLEGEEASFIAMVDGRHVLPLATSQDHKRRDDGDLGPNTGGMGAYSPAPVVTPRIHERVMNEVMWPTVRGARRGRHALYRLPVRRPDDRRRRNPESARVQLPLRRPGDAADPRASAHRPHRALRRRARRQARRAGHRVGSRARPSAWCSRPAGIRTASAKATSSSGSTPPPTCQARCSTPPRRGWDATSSPTAAACSAPSGSVARCAPRRSRRMNS